MVVLNPVRFFFVQFPYEVKAVGILQIISGSQKTNPAKTPLPPFIDVFQHAQHPSILFLGNHPSFLLDKSCNCKGTNQQLCQHARAEDKIWLTGTVCCTQHFVFLLGSYLVPAALLLLVHTIETYYAHGARQ